MCRTPAILGSLALLVACSSDVTGTAEDAAVRVESPSDANQTQNNGSMMSGSSTGSAAGSTTGGTNGGMGTTGGPMGPGPDAPPSGSTVRFVVLGDGGTGDDAQKKVASAVRDVCAMRGCEFALYLGDNIYENGPDGVDDQQFKDKFEAPYADLDFPFYVVLGNHDYTQLTAGVGFNAKKSDYEVEYTARSSKWNMPEHYFTFRKGPVQFFALDTNAIIFDQMWTAAEQQMWLDAEARKSDAPWKIAFGHHPYISNGYHGNAGNYDGIPFDNPVSPSGAKLKALVEHSVCNKLQVYFSGHDHNREWLEPQCGTTFIVSGAAAKLRDVASRDKPKSRFLDDKKTGFLWVEIDRDAMVGVFYDSDGKVDHEDMVRR